MASSEDTPNIVVLPPVLMGLGLVVILLLTYLSPMPISTSPALLPIGIAVAVLGVALGLWGSRALINAGTHISPRKPTLFIAATGPYRFTRNPLYVGFLMLLLGISVAVNSVWGFIVIIPVWLILHYGVIVREEQYLTGKFGPSYVTYTKSVRRYL